MVMAIQAKVYWIAIHEQQDVAEHAEDARGRLVDGTDNRCLKCNIQ